LIGQPCTRLRPEEVVPAIIRCGTLVSRVHSATVRYNSPTCSIKTALDFDRRLRLRDPLGTADPAAETGVACERYGSRATAYSKFTQDNGDMIADGFLAYT
jgi:hypothetical protein